MGRPHARRPSHFVHNVALATWVWVWGLAMLVQLYRPAERVTAMQVALLFTLVDATVSAVAGTFDPGAVLFFAPVFVATALHPARGALLSLRKRDDVDRLLLGLCAVAVVPVGLYALGQLNLQLRLTDDHAALGHYATMTYYSVSLLSVAVLAAFRNRDRRGAAYAAGMLAAVLAVASVFHPTASGLDGTWAALAALWGLAFVVTYEWRVRQGASRRVGPAGGGSIA